jgi:hypothetical protein
MVLNLGVCIRFLTKDLVANNVLICGLNFSAVVGFLKILVYLGLLTDVRIVGRIDLSWLVQ